MGTSIVDIVHMKEGDKEAFVNALSAISANVGLLTGGGMGSIELDENENITGNFWALSDLNKEDANLPIDLKKGYFRVGDDKNYILCEPVTKDDGTIKFNVSVVSDKFGVSSGENSFIGNVYIYEDENKKDRIRISSTGINVQKRNDKNSWDTIGRIYADKNANMIITNDSEFTALESTIKKPSSSSKIYHLRDSLREDDGANSLSIEGDGSFVSYYDGLFNAGDTKTNKAKAYSGTLTIPELSEKMILMNNGVYIKVGDDYFNTDSETTLLKLRENASLMGLAPEVEHFYPTYVQE